MAPLAKVRVEFIPDVKQGTEAPTSSAFTDDQGRFQLTYGEKKTGAVIAKHRVVIVQGRSDAGADLGSRDAAPAMPAPKAGPTVPRVYALAAQTPVQIDVTADKHDGYEVRLSSAVKSSP